LYKERVNRLKYAIKLEKVPDRVPILLNVTFFPTYYYNISPKLAMYNYEILYQSWKKFLLEFEPDSAPGPHIGSGKFFEILGSQNYAWPGHGVGEEYSFQFIEAEYMKENEYDIFIKDTSDFIVRNYLPRIFKKLKGLKYLISINEMLSGHVSNFIQFSKPEIREGLNFLLDAGNEAAKWGEATKTFKKEIMAAGFPIFGGAVALAPFDIIGNYLRGTRGIMIDIYRQPKKLLEALEIATSISIKMGLSNLRSRSNNPVVYMPLHKGGDDFLSKKQYETFYWPYLKEVILTLIKNGYFVYLFAEGSYNSRLKFIRELPVGKTMWRFDQTDMGNAKKELKDIACIAGNLPISLLITGSTEDVKEYVKNMIKLVSKDGGYIMCNGAGIDKAKPENIKAMIKYTQKYGSYN
jgi:uroporphyrinogen-III decarboxylase